MVGVENDSNDGFELDANDPRNIPWIEGKFLTPEAYENARFEAKYRILSEKAEGPIESHLVNRNYQYPYNVGARWELYQYAEPFVDITDLTVRALKLGGNETLVDVGTANGQFPYSIRTKYRHLGRLIGVEPNASQYELPPWEMQATEHLKDTLRDAGMLQSDMAKKVLHELIDQALKLQKEPPVELLEGSATQIPLAGNTVDVVTAMFMLYHLSRDEQSSAVEEFKRVMRPDGRLVVATSGATNKYMHRPIEKQLATIMSQLIGIEYRHPPIMNASFTSGYAMAFLSEHFRYVNFYEQDAVLTVDTEQKLLAYRDSLLSMRNQFEPEPDPFYFYAAVDDYARRVLSPAANPERPFADHISRMVLIASDVKYPIPEGFRKVNLDHPLTPRKNRT